MEKIKNTIISLLKWSERYTKTDMLYVAKGGFWLGIGQVVATLSAFLTSLAFANLLIPEAFGIYKYILSASSLLTITTLSGMDSAVTQSIARGFDGTLTVAVKEKIKWAIIGSIISIFIGLYYYFQNNSVLAISFLIVATFLPLMESFDMHNSLLWGKKLFKVQVNYNVIKKIIALASVVAAVFLTKNILIILFVYFISIFIPNLFFYFRTKKFFQENSDIDPEAIKYGKHLSLANIIGTLFTELDKILVFQFVGATQLAIYSLATAPNDQMKGLFKNINSLAMPKLSERTSSEIKNSLRHKILILSSVMTAFVIIYIIASPFLFKIFFPKYLSSVIYSQILSSSLIPVIVSGFIYTIFEAQKATKEIYQYNLYSNIFGIVTLFPLIFYFGIWGAILSRIATRFFGFILSLRLIKKM